MVSTTAHQKKGGLKVVIFLATFTILLLCHCLAVLKVFLLARKMRAILMGEGPNGRKADEQKTQKKAESQLIK